jgi:hypothetical protein
VIPLVSGPQFAIVSDDDTQPAVRKIGCSHLQGGNMCNISAMRSCCGTILFTTLLALCQVKAS